MQLDCPDFINTSTHGKWKACLGRHRPEKGPDIHGIDSFWSQEQQLAAHCLNYSSITGGGASGAPALGTNYEGAPGSPLLEVCHGSPELSLPGCRNPAG